MTRGILYFLFIFLPFSAIAQFSASSALSYDYGKVTKIPGLEAVLVLERIDASAELLYSFADSSRIEWHYHTASTDSLILSSVQRDTTLTTLDSLEQGCYELRVNDTVSHFFAVVDFSEYQPELDSVWVEDEGDSCNTVRLFASLNRPEIAVYDKLNDSTHLLPVPKTTYRWSTETAAETSPLEQEAPLEDVIYDCVPFSDDFFQNNDFAVLYRNPDTLSSDYYQAIAVRLVKLEPTIPEDEGKSNLLQTSSETEGSAPLDVTYSITTEGAVDARTWWVWNVDDSQPNSPTYRYQEQITHSFVKFVPNGYRVKVEISNDFCKVQDSMDVKVYESALEVPNILILGFGAEGQFKVAYNSLELSSFKAIVYDRWGRRVHAWDDPSLGWDGRSPVTNAFVSPGVYYCSIKARGTDGKKHDGIFEINVIREKGVR